MEREALVTAAEARLQAQLDDVNDREKSVSLRENEMEQITASVLASSRAASLAEPGKILHVFITL